jgi:putative hydrolase of the HAD superfamily
MEKKRTDIQVVFFDVAGTLLEVQGTVGDIYSRFARRYGVRAGTDDLKEAFARSFHRQPPLAFPPDTPEAELHIMECDWWHNVVRNVFLAYEFPQFDDFFLEVFEFFRSKDAWRLFDDVIPALTALRDRGFRLAIISNFDSRLDDLLQTFEIDHFFDGTYISSRIGVTKPDPRIFLAALKGEEPRKAIHIGDSLLEDVEGASAVGMRAILIDRSNKFGKLINDVPRA